MDEAVELRCQHHVDEDDGEHHGNREVARRLRQRARAAAEYSLVAGLEMQFLDLRTGGGQHVAQRDAVDVRVHRNLALPVVAIDRGRPTIVVQARDVADSYGAAAVRAADRT